MPLVTTTEMFKKAYDGGYCWRFQREQHGDRSGYHRGLPEQHRPVVLQVSKGARAI